MTRIYTLLLGVALTLNGCATAGPIAIKCGIQDVQIAAADYAEIKADIQSKNWTDLAKVGESIGWATLDCVLGDEATKNQAAKPSIDEFRRLHAVEFRSAKSACRSPGDATPKTGPTAVAEDPRSFAVVASGPVACGWRAYMADDTYWTFPRAGGAYQSPATVDSFSFGDSVACEAAPTASLDSTKTRGVRPALPGADGTAEATASGGAREPAGTPVGPAATILRAGPSAGRQAHNLGSRVQLAGPKLSGDFQTPTGEAMPARAGVSGDGFPLAVDPGEGRTVSARAETSPGLRLGPQFVDAVTGPGGSASPGKLTTFAYPGENPGAALERCDRTCGEHLTSLATVKGCLCWRGKGRSGHWVALREAPGLGLVATR